MYASRGSNRTTVTPTEANREAIQYDADNSHDEYMASLRLSLIRAGVITPSL